MRTNLNLRLSWIVMAILLTLLVLADTSYAENQLPAAPANVPSDASKKFEVANQQIIKLAQIALGYTAVLVAAGTVSMAFTELIKAISDFRQIFQRLMLSRWLGSKKTDVLPELLYLAIGDYKHESVLCGQPLEKMMGQIQAAARIALDYPEKFKHLFEFLATTDLEISNRLKRTVSVAHDDREVWKLHSSLVRTTSLRTTQTIDPQAQPIPDGNASDAAQARARLASLVARKLDGFQLRTQFWWERCNQTLSLLLSVFILVTCLPETLGLYKYAFGIIGGLLAPFAKDFSQALSKFASK